MDRNKPRKVDQYYLTRQSLNRDEIHRIFSDVDGLKKQQQEMAVEQLKLQRNIQKLESHDLVSRL
jgi:hypothetical protein